jgi:hypothetical protein
MACGDADFGALSSGPQDTWECFLCGTLYWQLLPVYSRCDSKLHALFPEDSCSSWTVMSRVVDSPRPSGVGTIGEAQPTWYIRSLWAI